MEKNLENYRKVYQKSELNPEQLPQHPLELFKKWFAEVEASKAIEEPNTMSISTLGQDGYPKSRIVLLKKITSEGFIFFTNYQSEKGLAIAAHPKVSLCFFWPELERQVIIKGDAEKTSSEISDNYFNSRPEGSRLGAIVSPQSSEIPNREFLENKLVELEKKYQDQPIKRPDHWGGYLIKPVSVEFWQGRPNRLHDRFKYELNTNSWKITRLAP